MVHYWIIGKSVAFVRIIKRQIVPLMKMIDCLPFEFLLSLIDDSSENRIAATSTSPRISAWVCGITVHTIATMACPIRTALRYCPGVLELLLVHSKG